jgi:putative transposase
MVWEEEDRRMKTSKFTDEQIAMALRQAEAGTPVGEICRKLGVSEQSFYRWKKRFGALGVSELREENRMLKGLVADLGLDKTILPRGAQERSTAVLPESGPLGPRELEPAAVRDKCSAGPRLGRGTSAHAGAGSRPAGAHWRAPAAASGAVAARAGGSGSGPWIARPPRRARPGARTPGAPHAPSGRARGGRRALPFVFHPHKW